MITATLHEAKAKLHQLVEAAEHGEDVVLLRGSQIVAALRPITAADVELAPRLSDEQAERFWAWSRSQKKKRATSLEGAKDYFNQVSKKSQPRRTKKKS